jgi:putative transposase
MYHCVATVKYRKSLIQTEIETTIKQTCQEISERYEIIFLEIGSDQNHIHFLIQSVPKLSPTQITTTVKSILAREIFKQHPEVKKQLWGGEFWTDGFYVNTVSRYGGEKQIQKYIENQGKNYE